MNSFDDKWSEPVDCDKWLEPVDRDKWSEPVDCDDWLGDMDLLPALMNRDGTRARTVDGDFVGAGAWRGTVWEVIERDSERFGSDPWLFYRAGERGARREAYHNR